MANSNVEVLIVDDTVVYRRILSDIMSEIPGVNVVAAVGNGQLALNRLDGRHVDLVLLDIEMPVMDGLATLHEIRRLYPAVGVVMVSGTNKNAAKVTIEALDAGAMDFITKPEGIDSGASRETLANRLRRLVNLCATRRSVQEVTEAEAKTTKTVREAVPAPSKDAGEVQAVPRKSSFPQRVDLMAIGVSTGGPNALAQLIPMLPSDFGVPIVIVQHMPPMFTASLAESLNAKSALTVKEAEEGDPLLPNNVYIAPGGRHMLIRRRPEIIPGRHSHEVALNDNPRENNCRPAVDVLFRSLATHFGKTALPIILTGMGEDGCKGVRAMKRQGSYCLTQSADSCVVYGMPRAVVEAGLSDEAVALDRMASRLVRILQKAAA